MNSYTRIIIGLAVAGFLALLSWAARRGRPTIVSDDGALLFRHNLLFRGFAFFAAFGVPLAITVLVLFSPPKNKDDFWAILGIYGLFGALGIPLWWEASRFAVILTSEGLDCRSPWRGGQFIAWDEIEGLSFSAINRWFIVRAKEGRKFRVPVFVSGVSEFLGRCEQHLRPNDLIQAKLGYLQVGRPFSGL